MHATPITQAQSDVIIYNLNMLVTFRNYYILVNQCHSPLLHDTLVQLNPASFIRQQTPHLHGGCLQIRDHELCVDFSAVE